MCWGRMCVFCARRPLGFRPVGRRHWHKLADHKLGAYVAAVTYLRKYREYLARNEMTGRNRAGFPNITKEANDGCC